MIKCGMCGINKSEDEIFKTEAGELSSICKDCYEDKGLPVVNEVVNIKCGKCGETKVASEFPRDKGRKSGRFPYCKKCQKELYLKRRNLDNVQSSKGKEDGV